MKKRQIMLAFMAGSLVTIGGTVVAHADTEMPAEDQTKIENTEATDVQVTDAVPEIIPYAGADATSASEGAASDDAVSDDSSEDAVSDDAASDELSNKSPSEAVSEAPEETIPDAEADTASASEDTAAGPDDQIEALTEEPGPETEDGTDQDIDQLSDTVTIDLDSDNFTDMYSLLSKDGAVRRVLDENARTGKKTVINLTGLTVDLEGANWGQGKEHWFGSPTKEVKGTDKDGREFSYKDITYNFYRCTLNCIGKYGAVIYFDSDGGSSLNFYDCSFPTGSENTMNFQLSVHDSSAAGIDMLFSGCSFTSGFCYAGDGLGDITFDTCTSIGRVNATGSNNIDDKGSYLNSKGQPSTMKVVNSTFTDTETCHVPADESRNGRDLILWGGKFTHYIFEGNKWESGALEDIVWKGRDAEKDENDYTEHVSSPEEIYVDSYWLTGYAGRPVTKYHKENKDEACALTVETSVDKIDYDIAASGLDNTTGLILYAAKAPAPLPVPDDDPPSSDRTHTHHDTPDTPQTPEDITDVPEEIGEPDVPLADLPDLPDGDPEEIPSETVDLADPEIPLADIPPSDIPLADTPAELIDPPVPAADSVPQTGDDLSRTAAAAGAASLGLFASMGALLRRRRTNR